MGKFFMKIRHVR